MGQYDAVDREAIWVALFALLQGSLGPLCQTMGRHHVQPPQLGAEQQPAAFLVQGQETRPPTPSGLPQKLILDGLIILYFQAPMPLGEEVGVEMVLGATAVNALLKAIDTALMPDNWVTGKQTLGGLVTHCWLEGEVVMDTGVHSQQGAALLPIKMLVP